MGHRHQAANIQELWDEMEDLSRSVSALQTRLAQAQKSAPAQENAQPPQSPRAPAPIQAASLWDVYPYTWAINSYNWSATRFHSFHEKLFMWRLTKHNRRACALFARQAGAESITPRLI